MAVVPLAEGDEQGDIQGERQSLADGGGAAFLVVPGAAVREPVPHRLLELGLGDERHGRQRELAHEPAQKLGSLLEVRCAVAL